MPPKKKVKRKGAKRKTRSVPAQKQSQKQVVNINIAKPKKRKKRRNAPVKQTAPYIPSISTMNMLSSDTARFDTLYNRLYDLQNTGTPRNPRTGAQSGVSGVVSPSKTPFSTPLVEPASAPVVQELPKAQAVEIVNPSLINSARSIYNMFDEIMGTSNQPTAQVRPSPPPPQAPPLQATSPPIQDLFNQPLEDELLADLISFNKNKLNETGDQADLISKTRPFSRVGEIGSKQNPTLAQVKEKMREEMRERTEGYETSANTTSQPIVEGGIDRMKSDDIMSQVQGLSGLLSMNAIDSVMNNLYNPRRAEEEEIPSLQSLMTTRPPRVEEEEIPSLQSLMTTRPPRADKGKKRGKQKRTIEKELMGVEDALSRYNESINWSGDSIAL